MLFKLFDQPMSVSRDVTTRSQGRLADDEVVRALAGAVAGAEQRAEMNEPRKLRPVTIEGPLRFVPVEEWAERHRRAGHHPQPTPTNENPERWDCDCGALWRILTAEQVRQKFAHLRSES
jgi:hypothetical protein